MIRRILGTGTLGAVLALAAGCVALDDPPRTVPYPSGWAPLRAAESSGDADCAPLSGTYANVPKDWDDAGQRMFTITLASLLGTPRDDGLNAETPTLGSGRTRDRHAATRVRLEVDRSATTLRAALDDAPLIGPPEVRCVLAERKRAAALEFRALGRALPQELVTAGVVEAEVRLHATYDGHLVARIGVAERTRGFDPVGYSPVKAYWLRYERVATGP